MTFYNIFSNKSKDEAQEQQNKNPIIIDTREKQSMIASCLKEKKANIKFETLEIADYLINNIAIERKTYQDFISSIINKRLFQQLDNLKKYQKHFLIIEGKRETDNKNLERASKGMILSTLLNYQIPIIFTENENETSDYLIILAKQQEKSQQEQALRYTPSNLTEQEQKQFILEGFEGIGPVTAKKLLKEFHSIKNIINADENQLKEILGIKYEKFIELIK